MKLISLLALLMGLFPQVVHGQDRPNVIVIMTDDQGIGDFGCMGNPLVQTPNIDQMYQRSVQFSNFYVHPVCTPTRACLMTGRYNYRTRAIDTYIGRAMMDPAEVTIAEKLKSAGYFTGIFGKWHLGDCYPMRAMDQGFDYAVVHRGGGIGQWSDPPGAEGAYTNPILFHNGDPRRERGYCTDVYFDHAIRFMEQCQAEEKPFFVYLADNCPHGPFGDVPKDWWEEYKDTDLSAGKYPKVEGGNEVSQHTNIDKNRRVFSMVSNTDENIGRLNTKLKEMGLYENTIVIFLTDNGPNGNRYSMGLRGMKTSVYEAGIKTLCLMQWPAKIKERKAISGLAAHIDLHPTILAATGVESPDDSPAVDGVSLMPLVDNKEVDWSQRKPIFIQTHRGNQPQEMHHFAVRDHRWKLLNHSGFGKEKPDAINLELYDLDADPFEKNNVIESNRAVADSLLQQYKRWFAEVSQTRDDNYAVPPIVLDPEKENPTVLTRQDIRRFDDANSGWGQQVRWVLAAEKRLSISAAASFKAKVAEDIFLKLNGEKFTTQRDAETNMIVFEQLDLEPGQYDFQIYGINEKGEEVAAHQVFINSRLASNRREQNDSSGK